MFQFIPLERRAGITPTCVGKAPAFYDYIINYNSECVNVSQQFDANDSKAKNEKSVLIMHGIFCVVFGNRIDG